MRKYSLLTSWLLLSFILAPLAAHATTEEEIILLRAEANGIKSSIQALVNRLGVLEGRILLLEDAVSGTASTTSSTQIGTSTLSVTADASSPSGSTVAGGATNVTIGVVKFRATGESMQLERLGLKLLGSSTPQDLVRIKIFDGTTQVGSAVFTGSNRFATSTFAERLLLPQNIDKTLIVKADFADVGTNEPGRAGDIVQIGTTDGINTKATGLSSGITVLGSGTATFAGFTLQAAATTPSPSLPIVSSGLRALFSFEKNTNDTIVTTRRLFIGGADNYTTAGKVKGGYSFDPTHFLTTPSSTLPTFSDSFSLAAWVKPTALPTAGTNSFIISKVIDDNDNWSSYAIALSETGKIRFTVQNRTKNQWPRWTTSNFLALNTFSHVTATLKIGANGSLTPHIYINGVDQQLTTETNGFTGSGYALEFGSGSFNIGRRGPFQPSGFTGVIDEVRVYDRALASDEVLAVVNAEKQAVRERSTNTTLSASFIGSFFKLLGL